MEIFDVDKTAIDCFLFNEYRYSGRDWFSWENSFFTLSDSIE